MAIKSILICWIVKVKDWSMRALNTKSDDEFQCKIKLHFKTISDIVTKLNKRMNNYMYGKSFKNQLISAASFQHCFSLTISLDCSLVRAWPFSGIERVSHSHYFHFSCGGGGAWWCCFLSNLLFQVLNTEIQFPDSFDSHASHKTHLFCSIINC